MYQHTNRVFSNSQRQTCSAKCCASIHLFEDNSSNEPTVPSLVHLSLAHRYRVQLHIDIGGEGALDDRLNLRLWIKRNQELVGVI
jgi:hypothetical protein